MDLPIFDSLTHPTPNGNWLIPKYEGKNGLELLVTEMKNQNVRWGLAVGMGPSIGGYKESSYASFINQDLTNLYPVAFMDFGVLSDKTSVFVYLQKLRDLGYIGIKIHPRFSGINYKNKFLPDIIKAANDLEIAVLLCTYNYECSSNAVNNNLGNLVELLLSVPNEKIILVHGGAVRVIEYMEIARSFSNVMLDLSLTLCKYAGSSIDLDIKFMFNSFDRRICVGSDGPEYTPRDLRSRFEFFAQGVSKEKLKNIAYKNLTTHLNLPINPNIFIEKNS